MKLETASHQENSNTKCPQWSVLRPVLVERPRRKQSAALQKGTLLVSYTSWNSRVIPAWLYGRRATHQWPTDSSWISIPAGFQGLPLNRIQVWRSPLWMWLESVHCCSRGFVVLSKLTRWFIRRHSIIQGSNARSDFMKNLSSNSTTSRHRQKTFTASMHNYRPHIIIQKTITANTFQKDRNVSVFVSTAQ